MGRLSFFHLLSMLSAKHRVGRGGTGELCFHGDTKYKVLHHIRCVIQQVRNHGDVEGAELKEEGNGSPRFRPPRTSRYPCTKWVAQPRHGSDLTRRLACRYFVAARLLVFQQRKNRLRNLPDSPLVLTLHNRPAARKTTASPFTSSLKDP